MEWRGREGCRVYFWLHWLGGERGARGCPPERVWMKCVSTAFAEAKCWAVQGRLHACGAQVVNREASDGLRQWVLWRRSHKDQSSETVAQRHSVRLG